MEAWQRADVGWSEKGRRSSDGEGSRTVGLVAVLLASVGFFSILSASGISVAAEEESTPPQRGVIITDSGLVLPVREVREGGFLVTTPCSREGLVSSGAHVTNVDIVIDPGHGGVETGAVGRGGMTEKNLNLSVALKTAAFLEERGYRVMLTRTTDIRLPIVVRAEIARALGAKVLVSIHHNGGATSRSLSPGTETFHQASNPDSRRLAGILYEEIYHAFSQYDIDWRYTANRGANAVVRRWDRKDLYGILRHNPQIVSVLTEAAYLTNRAEERLLSDPQVRAVEASAIADGIARYLTTAHPGSGYNGTIITSRTLYSGGTNRCIDPPLETETDLATAEATPYRDLRESHRAAVQAMSSQGILEGTHCDAGLFCPNDPIRRWELAVWLVRVIDGAEPKPSSAARFEDVDTGQWWEPHIQRLFTLGITRGCVTNPFLFCPGQTVTRGQMASLLVRAFELEGASESGYSDISNTFHAAAIETLAAAGLARECGVNPLRYCPHHPITRAQAADLLTRAQALVTSQEDPKAPLG